MARKHRIAVIPGDGIGKETVPESLKVLDAAARRRLLDAVASQVAPVGAPPPNHAR